MREVELKAVAEDWSDLSNRLVDEGAVLEFVGRLEDSRYDTPDRQLAFRDEVLRIRVYRDDNHCRAELCWKGPTLLKNEYKVREEIQTSAADAAVLGDILVRLGYVVTREIHRQVAQYSLRDATVRLERFPRMDDLVEVEGEPEHIEDAIRTLRMPRDAFTPERLLSFVQRYESRTGLQAALSDGELDGSVSYEDDV